jgi:2-phospho-L-lactate guanylyltransferase
MNMLWALVPVKQLSQSKQRLAAVLDPGEREGLVLAMLRDVLTAIQGVAVFDGVLLVSRSAKARALARDFGRRHRTRSSLALPGDVPRITAQDIDQIIAHHDCVTLVPNESGEGTNAVLTSPPNAITYHFGKRSLKRHVASADAAGISLSIVRNANLALDIDEPRDLARALADLPPSFTRDYLESSGIPARLKNQNISQTTERLGMPILADRETRVTR